MSLASFWCLYRKLCTYFKPSSNICIVTFELVNTGWDTSHFIRDSKACYHGVTLLLGEFDRENELIGIKFERKKINKHNFNFFII